MSHRIITLGLESVAVVGVLLAIYILVSVLDQGRAEMAVTRDSRMDPSRLNDQSTISPMARRLNAADSTPESDLVVLSEMFEYYCLGNDGQVPTGTNQEITLAFIQKDSLGLSFIGSDHTSISLSGELVDRWGSPYYFHAQSGQQMNIRSSGPDQLLHTTDDLLWPELEDVGDLNCPKFCDETPVCLLAGTGL